MIKADLEAADIPAVGDCGRKLDFHSLRHTCGTRMARNGVPLAVAQRGMRHSSPVLTANYYPHILIADKARELARLPAIAPTAAEREAIAKTGTNDAPALADDKIIVMPIDSNGTDAMGKIKTYMDGEDIKKTRRRARLKCKKSLRHSEKWRRGGDSNSRYRLPRTTA